MPLVDYGVIEERDFSPVEDGIYNAHLTNWDLVEAKEADKFPYYNLEFTAAEDAGIGKRKFWTIRSLSPKALFMFKNTMLALGASAADMEPGSQVDTDDIVASCMQAECRLVLKQVDYPKRDGSTGRKSDIIEVLSAPLPF